MGKVHELRIRSNRFVENINLYIQDVVDDNQQLLDLNREQLKHEHKTKKDQPISPEYSPRTAELKGFRTPDLFDTGEMQRTLTISATNDMNYYIDATVDYGQSLVSRYSEDIFGIAISKQSKAKEITTKLLAAIYRKIVMPDA